MPERPLAGTSWAKRWRKNLRDMVSAFFQLPQSKNTGERRDDRVQPEPHAGRRRRVDRHAGAPQAAVEQVLDEHAAGRMADEDRLLRALADDVAIMVEDLGDAERRELLVRLVAQLLRRAVVIGPVGRDDGEPLRLIARLDRVP